MITINAFNTFNIFLFIFINIIGISFLSCLNSYCQVQVRMPESPKTINLWTTHHQPLLKLLSHSTIYTSSDPPCPYIKFYEVGLQHQIILISISPRIIQNQRSYLIIILTVFKILFD